MPFADIQVSANIKAMNIPRILSAAAAGTTMMTLFSYLTSEARQKQFREPVLLNSLIKRLPVKSISRHNKSTAPGWLLHYAVGLMFSFAYDRVWQKTSADATIANGLLLGSISGVAGVAVWKKTFDMHPNPPKIPFQKYYLHLLAAHLVFGVFATLGYRLPGTKKI